jgi:triosephosphate isomerase (TIM)
MGAQGNAFSGAAGREPIVAGNWKMNTSQDEALELIEELIDPLDEMAGVGLVVCPPFIWLPLIYENTEGTSIHLGAQTMHWAERGAYTGEISPAMVAEFCTHVILGHSERRQLFGETDEGVNKKTRAALEHELIPIVCVGEDLEQREAGATLPLVTGQVRAALAGLTSEQVADLVIAYEPIWAIGTGRAATADDANEVIGAIRRQVATLHGDQAAAAVRLLYGGSVNGKNIDALMAMPEIDGALVGGASLNAGEFVRIAEAAARARA